MGSFIAISTLFLKMKWPQFRFLFSSLMFLLLSVSLSDRFCCWRICCLSFLFWNHIQSVGFNLLFFFFYKMFASEISCSEYLMLLCMSLTCFDIQLKVIEVSTLFYEVNSSRVSENFELYVRLCQFWILRVFFPCNPHLSDCMCAQGDEGYFWEKWGWGMLRVLPFQIWWQNVYWTRSMMRMKFLSCWKWKR